MYETQNKRVIGHLAKADLKSKKMGNLFIAITIILAASLLMVMGLFSGSVKLDMQRKLVSAQDVIYQNVNKEQIGNLRQDSRISYMTLDKLGQQMEVDDYIIWQVYYDGSSETIKTMELVEGKLPQQEKEVVVSKAYIEKLGKEAKVGMKISVPLLSGETEEYVVSGFIKAVKNSNLYPIVHSKAYAETGSALKDIRYDALAKIDGSTGMSQAEFLDTVRDIGEQAGVPRAQVNENNNFLETLPEGKFTGNTLTMAIIGVIILAAAVMVIYSIFYISISGKTREYGQLRTLGMTRKQIRKFVRREGMILAARAVPAGILLGGIVSFLIRPGGFSFTRAAVMAVVAFAVILLTILISVMKPAKMAASVSPVEAVRYSAYTGESGQKKTARLQRKITPFSLARMNTARNRKKTFITMLSLGIGGVLFIGVMTYAASVDSDQYVRTGQFQLGEFTVSLSGNATQTARHGAAEVQLDNPLTREVEDEMMEIPGVKQIHKIRSAYVSYDYKDQARQEDMVTPFTKSEFSELKECLTEGALDYRELLSGNQIVIRANDQVEEIYGWRFQPGDKVTIHYYDGEEFFKTYEIAGVVKGFKDGLTNGWFLLPQQVLTETLPGVDLTDTFVVETREGQRDKVEEPLGEIVDAHPQLSMSTLRQQEAQSRDMWNQTILILVSIVLFIICFSMINLVNTLISNFMSQKTELAMLQSIGMSGKQIQKMIIGEGLILAVGNIFISILFGSLAGYGVCRLMENLGASYMDYQFPLMYCLIYAAVVLLVPCVIAFFMIRRFRKESLMERLREV